ncbi:hypothetical protein BH11MYX1_BH11MYX1_11490 [soil metagenome]
MAKVRRWIKRIVLGTLGFGLLAIGGALLFIHTDRGRDFIRRKVESALLDTFPGGFSIGHIEGSAFGTLVIDDLRINGRDGKPMIVVGTARVKLELGALLHHTARTSRLELEDVTFDKHPLPDPPVPEIPKPASGPSKWAVEIPHATIVRGHLVIAGAAGPIIDLHDLDVEAAVSIDDGITVAAHARGTLQNKPITLPPLPGGAKALDGVVKSIASTGLPGDAAARDGEAKSGDRDAKPPDGSAKADGHANSIEVTVMLGYSGETLLAPLAFVKVGDASLTALAIYAGPHVDGVVRAHIPAATVKALANTVIPGDADLVITAIAGSIDAKVSMVGASMRALLQTDLVAKAAKGFIVADVPDARRLDPRLAGGGIATASIDASSDHVRGILTVDGMYRVDKATVGQAAVKAKTLVAVDASLPGAWLFIQAASDLGNAHATAIAEITREKAEYILKKSTFVASARRVGARKTDLYVGSVTTSLRASGPMWPMRAVKVNGTIGGDAIRFGDLAIRTVDVSFVVTKQASGHVELGGVSKGGKPLGSVSLDAHGSLQQTAAGNVITVDLDDHSITTAANGTWAGAGGHVVIDPGKITVTGFHSGSGDGTLDADVDFTRATKRLRTKVDATNVQLATLAPTIKGVATAKLTVERSGGRWSGGGHVEVAKLTLPNQPVVDLDADIKIAGRHVELDATAVAEAGAVVLRVDLEGPSDLTDRLAWKRLDRRAITEIGFAVSHLDLAKLGRPKLNGSIDGKLGITSTTASGDLAISNIVSDAGTFGGDLTLAPNGHNLDVGIAARLDGTEVVDGVATIALPLHPFNPAGWTALGERLLKSAQINIKPIDVDPVLLAKFKIHVPYHAKLDASITAAEGADSVTVKANRHGLAGGILKQPIDVAAVATLDEHTGLVAGTTVSVGKQDLVRLTADAPVTALTLAALKSTKLHGLVEFPDANAKDLAAVIGRGDVSGGTLTGTIKVDGTIGVPTAKIELALANIVIPASLMGRKPAMLESLGITGSWDGTLADLEIAGNETKGSTLRIKLHGDPRHREAVVASVDVTKFDLAPITAFATGAISAARGTIDAHLTLNGIDPDTGVAEGTLKLTNGRFPLSALLGTLRQINADVTIANHQVKLAKLEAKLGQGKVTATGTVDLAGSVPKKLHAEANVYDVSLVRAFQPTMGAIIAIDLESGGGQWTGNIDISRAHVELVKSGGVKLLDASPPGDIVFVDEAGHDAVTLGARPPPTKPWLVSHIKLHPTAIEVLQDQFQVRGSALGNLELSLGQGSVGLDGTIEATRAAIDVLGTRSTLEIGQLNFDGTTDPLLNVRVIRELDSVTVIAQITGRASAPQLEMSSDAGTYTQGELYAMFIGGQASGSQTGGNAAQAGEAAGAGYASSVASSKINDAWTVASKKLGLNFNVRLDFNYEVGTATSSDAIRVGYWYNSRIFIAGRTRPAARVDENSNEVLLEYHLRGNSLIQATGGDRGYDGIDYVRRWHW